VKCPQCGGICTDTMSGHTRHECVKAHRFDGESFVNHPKHYNDHPSGVECITIVEHFGFNLGNAVKYIWRAGLKNDVIEDLKKARWYLDREISRREAAK
jgi:hypothetical protein